MKVIRKREHFFFISMRVFWGFQSYSGSILCRGNGCVSLQIPLIEQREAITTQDQWTAKRLQAPLFYSFQCILCFI